MISELVSPTPWSVGYIPNANEYTVCDADGKRVTRLESLALSGRGAINEANAAYIIEAVNAHERLIEALVDIVDIADGYGVHCDTRQGALDLIGVIARNAIGEEASDGNA